MAKVDLEPGSFIVGARPRLGRGSARVKMGRDDYERRLERLQKELLLVQQAYLGTHERAVIVLEGWDTAGKGGIVRRLGWALDPRSFRAYPIGAPDGRERSQHYLQRFWERLPEHGQIVVFDRSWYGRVLVERVEGLAAGEEWRRAYGEIVAFERSLAAAGFRLVKIFLDITRETQLERFAERLTDPYKRWKLTLDDFRNHARWRDYEQAILDMLRKTSAEGAPWHLVPADSQRYARLAALAIILERLSRGIDLGPRPLDPAVAKAAARVLGSELVEPIVAGGGEPGPGSG